MMGRKIVGALAVAATLCGLQAMGCATACKTAASYATTGQGLIEEADAALGQAEVLFMAANPTMDPTSKAKLVELLRKGHEGLQKASVLLRQSRELCEAIVLKDVFGEFNAAWNMIRELLPLVAATVGAQSGKAAPLVSDPSCYLLK